MAGSEWSGGGGGGGGGHRNLKAHERGLHEFLGPDQQGPRYLNSPQPTSCCSEAMLGPAANGSRPQPALVSLRCPSDSLRYRARGHLLRCARAAVVDVTVPINVILIIAAVCPSVVELGCVVLLGAVVLQARFLSLHCTISMSLCWNAFKSTLVIVHMFPFRFALHQPASDYR